ncbi:hypothetical protein Cadr_000012179 [Camelus dromedarius]|uniref:Uncharacterized protein n=1 Tax=Camelus dromedarius TaxID=9838 RepID=A0A5N4DQE0_CAMDR|nr:hypothetical protein Cadr_000012179 [Camelus dromedarius]
MESSLGIRGAVVPLLKDTKVGEAALSQKPVPLPENHLKPPMSPHVKMSPCSGTPWKSTTQQDSLGAAVKRSAELGSNLKAQPRRDPVLTQVKGIVPTRDHLRFRLQLQVQVFLGPSALLTSCLQTWSLLGQGPLFLADWRSPAVPCHVGFPGVAAHVIKVHNPRRQCYQTKRGSARLSCSKASLRTPGCGEGKSSCTREGPAGRSLAAEKGTEHTARRKQEAGW